MSYLQKRLTLIEHSLEIILFHQLRIHLSYIQLLAKNSSVNSLAYILKEMSLVKPAEIVVFSFSSSSFACLLAQGSVNIQNFEAYIVVCV